MPGPDYTKEVDSDNHIRPSVLPARRGQGATALHRAAQAGQGFAVRAMGPRGESDLNGF